MSIIARRIFQSPFVLKDLRVQLASVLVGSLVIALSAQVNFNIGPVPITLQTLPVLLVGALLGARLGVATILVYISEGFIGLPVFANLKNAYALLAAPASAGYIIGFIFAAYLAGYLFERYRTDSNLSKIALLGISSLPIYLFGLLWLYILLPHLGSWHILLSGCIIFLPGDLLKIIIASNFLPKKHPEPAN